MSREKDGVAAHKGHDQTARQRVPGHPRLTPPFVGERVARQTLGFARRLEAEEAKGHDAEIDQLRRRHQAGEPAQHHRGAVADLQKAEQAEQQDNQNAVDGHPLARASPQHSRRFALERQAEQTSTRAVDITVSSAEGGRQDGRVHDIGQDSDAKPIHCDHVGTRRRSRLVLFESVHQLATVVRNVDPHRQAAEHEESHQPIKHLVVRSWHHHPRILRFTRDHADVIGPCDGEAGLNQALQEAEEATERTGFVQLGERTRLAPVAKSEAVVKGIAAEHGDKGVDDETDDQQDFAESKPEFSLAIPFHSGNIDESIIHRQTAGIDGENQHR